MRIREAQVHHFEEARRREFAANVKTYLLGFHFGCLDGLSNQEIDERIDRALRRAERFAITQARSLTVFVSLAFIVGPEFDLYPAAQAILRNPDMPANDKPIALLRRISSQQWHDAAHRGRISS